MPEREPSTVPWQEARSGGLWADSPCGQYRLIIKQTSGRNGKRLQRPWTCYLIRHGTLDRAQSRSYSKTRDGAKRAAEHYRDLFSR